MELSADDRNRRSPASSCTRCFLVQLLRRSHSSAAAVGSRRRIGDAGHRRAVVRVRDAIADAPASSIMLELNDRIERISRGHVRVRALLTSATYGMLLRRTIGERDAAQLYAPFETFIPKASLG
jgi:hypothetical protein